MNTAIQIVKDRILDLKVIIGLTPLAKTFQVQSRLIEAEKILELLKAERSIKHVR